MKTLASILFASLIASTTTFAQEMEMRIDADQTLRITGGAPNKICLMALGVDEQRATLPGGAMLRLVPLSILTLGQFDALGNFELEIKYQGDSSIAWNFLAQAGSVNEHGEFRTTDLEEIQFDGDSRFEMIRRVAVRRAPPANHENRDTVVRDGNQADRDRSDDRATVSSQGSQTGLDAPSAPAPKAEGGKVVRDGGQSDRDHEDETTVSSTGQVGRDQ